MVAVLIDTVLVTEDTPAGADLQEVEPVVGGIHESFCGNHPAGADGAEETPAVFRDDELGRTIRTERSAEIVLLGIIVVETADVGFHAEDVLAPARRSAECGSAIGVASDEVADCAHIQTQEAEWKARKKKRTERSCTCHCSTRDRPSRPHGGRRSRASS